MKRKPGERLKIKVNTLKLLKFNISFQVNTKIFHFKLFFFMKIFQIVKENIMKILESRSGLTNKDILIQLLSQQPIVFPNNSSFNETAESLKSP